MYTKVIENMNPVRISRHRLVVDNKVPERIWIEIVR
jgi:hypothetical protein